MTALPSMNVLFNKIMINAVETSSAVLVGNNAAYGWRSIRKDNSGFGSVHGGTIHHNINLVIDNDAVDFPIDDRGVFIHRQASPVQQKIHFDSIDVNAVTTNSTVAVGENSQPGWNAIGKNNYGDGRHKGINVLHHNVNSVVDDDWIDAPVVEGGAGWSVTRD